MKKLKVLGTVAIVCALVMSMGAMVFGADPYKTLENKHIVNRKSYSGVIFSVDDGDSDATLEVERKAQVFWNSNKTNGRYYFGFDQRKANGTFGGGSRTPANILATTPSGGKIFREKLHDNWWKPVIGDYGTCDFYTTRVLVFR